MYDYYSMGSRLLIARLRKGIKQREVANDLGISQSSYSDMENGKREITISQLFILSNSLDVSIEWLLGLELYGGLSDSELIQIEEYKQFLLGKRKKK